MNTLSPNDECNALLATAVDGVVNFSNVMVNALEPSAREALNLAILAGAAVKLTIQLTPTLAVKGTVEAAGQAAQLFDVQFPNRPSELLN